MRTKFLVVLNLILLCVGAMAQGNGPWYKWEVTLIGAYEEHDMRFFENYPNLKRDDLHDDSWGTWWYGVAVKKTILENDFYRIKVGLGYASEMRTLHRPYDAGRLLELSIYNTMLTHTNRYKIKHVQVPLDYSVRLNNNLRVNTTLLSDFNFFKRAAVRDINGEYSKGHSKFSIDFYSISFYPGLQLTLDHIYLRLDYRLWQFKKIDNVISPDPHYYQEIFETYNPTNLRFTVSYAFGKKGVETR